MSLVSLLLGLPSKVKKLRGNNAPAVPLTLPANTMDELQLVASSYGNLTQFVREWRPPGFSHYVEHRSLNNASVVSIPVADISGKGTFDAVWLLMRREDSTGAKLVEYEVEVIVDGVNISPGFLMSVSMSDGRLGAWSHSVVGGASITPNFSLQANSGAYEPQWAKATSPIPFKQSLVVNIIHKTSDTLYAYTRCWVNAWLTE
jgi:hypothetical protein